MVVLQITDHIAHIQSRRLAKVVRLWVLTAQVQEEYGPKGHEYQKAKDRNDKVNRLHDEQAAIVTVTLLLKVQVLVSPLYLGEYAIH